MPKSGDAFLKTKCVACVGSYAMETALEPLLASGVAVFAVRLTVPHVLVRRFDVAPEALLALEVPFLHMLSDRRRCSRHRETWRPNASSHSPHRHYARV